MNNNYKKFGLHLKCNIKYKVCDNPYGSTFPTFSFEGCIIDSS